MLSVAKKKKKTVQKKKKKWKKKKTELLFQNKKSTLVPYPETEDQKLNPRRGLSNYTIGLEIHRTDKKMYHKMHKSSIITND